MERFIYPFIYLSFAPMTFKGNMLVMLQLLGKEQKEKQNIEILS